MFRFIFTGDREWTDVVTVRRILETIKTTFGPNVKIVHGAARGLDLIVGTLAIDIFGIDNVESYPAKWKEYGKRAGPIRNQEMLTESLKRARLDGYVLKGGFAFHNNLMASKGTKDMVKRLEDAKFKVKKVTSV